MNPKKPSSMPEVFDEPSLPREQVGPFLLLGVDKTATKEEIEAHWAQRVIWARKNQIKTPLEDVNWAREALSDWDKRIRADAASLNLDTTDGVLRRLSERYGGHAAALSKPLDLEKALADYDPPIEVPSVDEVKRTIAVPEPPRELPAVQRLLEQLAQEPLDPWNLGLEETGQ
jgi:hypothetical protein